MKTRYSIIAMRHTISSTWFLFVCTIRPGLCSRCSLACRYSQRRKALKWRWNPLFSSHEALNIRIEAPISQLMQDRPEDEYLEGKLSYTDAVGAAHELDLKIQTRAEYRRQKKTCSFAPIRLNLCKKQVVGTVFADQDKWKFPISSKIWMA